MSTVSDVTIVDYSGDYRVDSLLYASADWNYLLPTRTTLFYTFDLSYASSKVSGVSVFNASQQAAAMAILAYVSSVTGVTFAPTASGSAADFHFANANLAGATTAGLCQTFEGWSSTSGNVLVSYNAEAIVMLDNVEFFNINSTLVAGGSGYEVLLHEIGHALGLGHPFEGPFPLPEAEDNTNNSVMSYTSAGTDKSTYQSFDLLTLAWIYGEDGLGNNYGYNSTFGPTLGGTPSTDTLAPTVTSFNPADEATGIAVGSNIVLIFSEAIARGTGNIVLKTTAGAIVATYDAATSSNLSISGNTLTINPTADLAAGTGYKVEFAVGSIHDLAGNSYAGTSSYNFTTANASPTLPTPLAITYTDTSGADVFIETNAILLGQDADGGTLSYGITGGSPSDAGHISKSGTYGSLLVNTATGAYTFFPNGSAIEALKTNSSEHFTVTVSDGSASASATLNVNVAGANDAPTLAQAQADQNISSASVYTYTVPAQTFVDRDTGDTLSYSATLGSGAALPAWLSFNTSTRSFSGTPTNSNAGALQILVRASDSGGLSTSDTFTLNIAASSAISGIVADGYISGAALYIDANADGVADPFENTGAVTDASGNFSLQTTLVGTLIAIGGTNIDSGLPNTMTLSAPAGSRVINPLTTVVQQIAYQLGISTSQAEAQVQTALGISANVDLTQYDPLAQPAADSTALAVQQVAAQVATLVTLAPQGDTTFSSIAAAVANAGSQPLDLGNITTLQTILPTENAATLQRVANINQAIADTSNRTDIATVQETALNDSNDAPVLLTPIADQRTSGGAVFSYQLPANTFIDLDPTDTLSFAATLGDGANLPNWLTFNAVTHTFSGTPTAGSGFSLSVRVSATDSLGASSSDTFNLHVGGQINGTAAADTLSSTPGNDSIDGGAGIDTANYTGQLANYTLVRSGSTYTVTDKTGAQGTDTLTSIETLMFTDLSVNLQVQGIAAAAPQADVDRICELYVAFFNRTPDADGLAYWIGQHAAGQTISQISESFYSIGASATFASLTGFSTSMTNEDFIHVFYKNVLGRPEGADAGGLAYWNKQLADGTSTRGSLANDILGSAHTFKGNATWGWVADLLDNKLTVARTIAIDWGLTYNTDPYSRGVAIAAAVTPTSADTALALIGVNPTDIDLV